MMKLSFYFRKANEDKISTTLEVEVLLMFNDDIPHEDQLGIKFL